MASPLPVKILQITQTTLEVTGLNEDPNDFWYGYPNKWRVLLAITPSAHSSFYTQTPFQYDGLDVKIGDWIATSSGGIAVRIESIESQTSSEVIATVFDVDGVNIVNDKNMSGTGIGPDGFGYLFELNDVGEAILGPIGAFTVDITFQTDLAARFANHNVITKYVNVTQPDHGLSIGDIIAVNPTSFGTYVKATDPVLAIGIVNSINVPSLDNFTFKPFGEIVTDVVPDLVGNYGDVFFMDPSNPGGLTTIRPLTNARPIYLRLETPNKAVLFASGTAGGALASGGDNNDTLVVIPTLNQTEFTIPGAFEVMIMSINGIENTNFTFDNITEVLTFDPVATGYGVDPTDEVIFIYRS
jgi:hypothetical protein